ncbi:2-keto-4-pentenoate hydratase [Cupriavidus oxalaticus]|jgi:2-keto-4-pentenoate hydratase|uniref:2-keto-4-pentenoate hydratase n=1 Tax=Cupriavidus oxalaticus TaxID=96344 RepID=A0A375GMR2_9BURK|nr:fumarylacetoacetate hydrolase family protein [Cupriavidus oxalaticus]QEZ43426.1 2-keto-4-pentenoate hydratase [Cupriavidus oxalaticus]QRQ85182.1 fumarylacetoacetate hydrolase family protein [Cupriavidus oxalaticus]QRQ90730.1 fumarylacetoacetate hydrolase family protein [Cupriavidus oxalaticus]WQD85257.1 fumarylacetoacetate hydrolase family protein [Cupriavidus oxalaticus]SPC23411.1 2-keto-4-pentenoate hydratase [Cupriavidus oxalaticus]
MLNPELIQAADQLWSAAEHRQPCPPVREAIAQAAASGADPVALAYAIQQHNTERARAAGRRLVGRKIGLTSTAVQRQLGVDQPDFGMLFADMARQDGEDIDCGDVLQPKVEAEVALVLERDLPHATLTVADVIRATAFALPAIEIVGSRIADWNIRLTDTVADNASSGLFVLGTRPVALAALDLVNCGMSMELAGEPVSVGAGAACLGNPLNAAVWLANTMARVGAPLKAGDVILTGALGPMVPVRPGNVFTAHIEGLGAVTASFRTASKEGNA